MWRTGIAAVRSSASVRVPFCHRAAAQASHAEIISFTKPLPTVPLASSEKRNARTRCELSVFENGLTVGSVETDSAVTLLNIAVRAGSRYERADELGVSHYLRRVAYKSTASHTTVHMARMPELLGSSLSSTSGREIITYSGLCLQDNSGAVMNLLSEAVVQPEFHHWEVRDASDKVRVDLEAMRLDPMADLLNSLHNAAYRNTLQNSPFCPSHRIGEVDDVMVRAFYDRLYIPSRMAVVGVGIPHTDLVQFCMAGGLHNMKKSDTKDDASVFTKTHREVRLESGDKTVLGAIVGRGASLSGDQVLIAGVLQRILGTGVQLEYGCNASTSKITAASEKAVSGGAKVATLNFNYSDSGLFGVFAKAKVDSIRPCLKAAWREVSRFADSLTQAELARAKAQLKTELLGSLETRADMAEDISMQVLLRGKYLPPGEAVNAVDSITAEQVSKFAKQVASSSHILALSGDLRNAPYIDELTV